MGRRLLYHWCIPQKNETELVRQVFNAQKGFPTDGCWISEVPSCNMRYSEDGIRKMKFKKIVKEKHSFESFLVSGHSSE